MNIIQNSQVNSKYFHSLAAVVNKTTQSDSHAEAWFSSNKIRSSIFNFLNYSQKPDLTSVAEKAWNACVYTAPLLLTMLAPKHSYQAIENDVIGLSLDYHFEDNYISMRKYSKDLSPPSRVDVNNLEGSSKKIDLGLEKLKKTLEEEIEQYQGRAFLCFIYGARHVFTIEKRGSQYYILQSYLDHYTFESFLLTDNQHAAWNLEELISSLQAVLEDVSDQEWSLKSANIYQKLFHIVKSSKLKTELDQKNQIVPFAFIATDPYSLDWRNNDHYVGIYTEAPGTYELKGQSKLSKNSNEACVINQINQLILSKGDQWFVPLQDIEATELAIALKPICNEDGNIRKESQVFTKMLFHRYLNHRVLLHNHSTLTEKEYHLLLSLLPWPNIPLPVWQELRYAIILWNTISERAANGEVLGNPTAIKRVQAIAHYIDNSNRTASFFAEASPELIRATVPHLATKYNNLYRVTEEIERGIESSKAPNKAEQLEAFRLSLGK